MKKIALTEDRYSRQRDFLNQTNINLDNFDMIDNFVEEKVTHLVEGIVSNNFNLDKYDVIICHKSIEQEEKTNSNTIIIDRLIKYCEDKNKTLVLFSGGIDANYYKEKYLELNSKTFYSLNLKIFLESRQNEENNILMLCYGPQWKLNIMLNILEKINNYLEEMSKESDRFKRFSKNCKLNLLESLKLDIETLQLDGQNISKIEIKRFRDNLYTKIKKSVIYE